VSAEELCRRIGGEPRREYVGGSAVVRCIVKVGSARDAEALLMESFETVMDFLRSSAPGEATVLTFELPTKSVSIAALGEGELVIDVDRRFLVEGAFVPRGAAYLNTSFGELRIESSEGEVRASLRTRSGADLDTLVEKLREADKVSDEVFRGAVNRIVIPIPFAW